MLFFITAGHIFAVMLDLYTNGSVWIDIPLHVGGGMFFGFLWLWFLGRSYIARVAGQASSFFLGVSILFAALLGSLVWELFELAVTLLSPDIAFATGWHTPSLKDALTDMIAGIVGGLFVVSIAIQYIRANE
jgi:hypothetical protein